MRHVKSEVSTINVRLAASMGSFLLVGGAKGKRLALPHSRVMIHQPSMGGIQGQASDIKVEAEMILGIRERVVNYYSQLSGQPREKVAMDLDRDNFLSPRTLSSTVLSTASSRRRGAGFATPLPNDRRRARQHRLHRLYIWLET